MRRQCGRLSPFVRQPFSPPFSLSAGARVLARACTLLRRKGRHAHSALWLHARSTCARRISQRQCRRASRRLPPPLPPTPNPQPPRNSCGSGQCRGLNKALGQVLPGILVRQAGGFRERTSLASRVGASLPRTGQSLRPSDPVPPIGDASACPGPMATWILIDSPPHYAPPSTPAPRGYSHGLLHG